MQEVDVKRTLLVRAFEEADTDARVLTAEARQRATEDAVESAIGGDDDLLRVRSLRLFGPLVERWPSLLRLVDGGLFAGWTMPLGLLAAAFLAGFLFNPLASTKELKALNLPLLGIVAWNLVIYALLLGLALRRVLSRGDAHRAERDLAVSGPAVRACARLVQRGIAGLKPREGSARDTAAAALESYSGRWLKTSQPLVHARAALLFHLLAMTFAVGNVAGMYFCGLSVEYHLIWESTFLGEAAIDAVLGALLGPAAWLLGREIPGVGASGGSAAAWFHLSAASAALFVLLPRAALAFRELSRSRRLARRLPLDTSDPYFRRLLAPVRGEGRRIDVIPFEIELDRRRRDGLNSVIEEQLGALSRVVVADCLGYDATTELLAERLESLDAGGGTEERIVVLLCDLARTPEPEVHGRIAGELANDLGAKTPLLVLVDDSVFRSREDEERVGARRESWDRVLETLERRALHVDLGAGEARVSGAAFDEALAALPSATPAGSSQWPDSEAADPQDLEPVVIDDGDPRVTVDVSLISHTNVGKTTLARTLLRRDVGRVLDRAHVTRKCESWLLLEDEERRLRLWDTPGFGDTARLARRFQHEKNPIGWFMHRVWDRHRNRALWLNQQTLRAIHDAADLVIYVVDASDDPDASGYIDEELRLLEHFDLPVLLLLNHTGGKDDAVSREQDWTRHVEGFSSVRAVVSLDAFARCWSREGVLLDLIREHLPAPESETMAALIEVWRRQSHVTLDLSVQAVTELMKSTATDQARLSGKFPSRLEKKRAQSELADRLEQGHVDLIRGLIRAHGLEADEAAIAELRGRLQPEFIVPDDQRLNPKRGAIWGGLVSGAAGGVIADALTGGLSFGSGFILGGIGGALAGSGLARGFEVVQGPGVRAVTWAPGYLTALYRYCLLSYLAVAHFGRGRGRFRDQDENDGARSAWSQAVDEHLAACHLAIDSQWKAASASGDSEAAEESWSRDLESRVHASLHATLLALYPELAKVLPPA